MKLQGIFPALATCFDSDGNLYKAKVFHNIERLNQIALAGYTVCGSTGETPLLSSEERIQLMRWVKEAAADSKTLIAGVGADSVHETVRMANCAASIGFHAALVLTPFYYRVQMHRPDTQLLFFRAVADRSELPVLIYNIPQITGYALPPETIAELSHHPNIVGMKDSSGNLEKLAETVRVAKPGFQVLSGSGSNFHDALKLGASGAILAIANALPYACVTIWEAFRTRQDEAGQDWMNRILPASKLIAQQYGIPGLKYAMDLNGYYGGPPRLPFIPPSAEVRAEIERTFHGLKG
ncbi:MAG: dihydrodipicolinate synthase family protein [Acidobacteriaceae bacterium]|nr:dihydrodipicolinate synthase family protein [Acidobacteriaceae bacterium]